MVPIIYFTISSFTHPVTSKLTTIMFIIVPPIVNQFLSFRGYQCGSLGNNASLNIFSTTYSGAEKTQLLL